MKHKKFIIMTLTAMAFFITIFGTISANAAKWYKGNPPIVRDHRWITDFNTATSNKKDPKEVYSRNFVPYMNNTRSFFIVQLLYDKDKKFITNWGNEALYYPYYKKVGNNIYKVVGSTYNKERRPSSRELNSNSKKGPYLLFKIYDNNTIDEWQYNLSSKGKQYNGRFHATDFSFQSSLSNSNDPSNIQYIQNDQANAQSNQ